jgi:hypothetical protein
MNAAIAHSGKAMPQHQKKITTYIQLLESQALTVMT